VSYQRLRWREGHLTITGVSPSAAHLIDVFAKSSAFRDPTFESPVTQSDKGVLRHSRYRRLSLGWLDHERSSDGHPRQDPCPRLCVLAIAAIYLVIVTPLIRSMQPTPNSYSSGRNWAQLLQRSAKALPALRGEADAAQDQASDEDLLLDGDSDSVAAAALQSTVKDLVESAGHG